MVGIFFMNMGLNVINLWPDTSPIDRETLMRDFNDPDNTSQVLICNIKANAFGVNL